MSFAKFSDTNAQFQEMGRRIDTCEPIGMVRNPGVLDKFTLCFAVGERVMSCGRLLEKRRVLTFDMGQPIVASYEPKDILAAERLSPAWRKFMDSLSQQFRHECLHGWSMA
jgi:hypothetical protein